MLYKGSTVPWLQIEQREQKIKPRLVHSVMLSVDLKSNWGGGGGGLGDNMSISVLGILHLRQQWDIQVNILDKQLEIWNWTEGETI